MIDIDFIKRCNSPEFQKLVQDQRKENHFRSNKWQRENPELQQECIRKYSETEKGKIACKRRHAIRTQRVRELIKDLTDDELEEIRMFYVNCPKGHEVDHIHPISKGGRHHISNLQYLTKIENRKKGSKIISIEDL